MEAETAGFPWVQGQPGTSFKTVRATEINCVSNKNKTNEQTNNKKPKKQRKERKKEKTQFMGHRLK